MKKFNLFKTILLTMLIGGVAIAADEVIRQDKLKLGRPGSGADKVIELDTGSVNNAQVSSDSAQRLKLRSNTVRKGRGAATDIIDEFDIGAGSNNPKFRWNNTTGKIEFAHDGVTYEEVGSGGGGGGGGGVLLNENSGFEDGSTNWTASGGTFTINTTLSNVGFGLQSGSWDASAASQTLSNDAVTIPAGLFGKVCSLSWYYKGGDANIKAQVYDGTNVIAESSAFTAETNFSAKKVIYFTCPSSGTMQARFVSSADAAIIYLDDVRLGQEVVANGGGYQIYGALHIPVSGSCGDGWSVNAGGAFADVPADNDCAAPVTSGKVQAAGTNIPGFIVQDAGDYIVTVNGGRLSNTNVSDGATGIRITDGTNSSQGVTIPTTATSGSSSSWSGNFTFLLQGVAAGSTIRVQLAPKSGTTAVWHNGSISSEVALNFVVSRINSAAVDTISVDKMGWRIDANIGGANASLNIGSTYVETTDSGLDMVLASGSAPAEIPCSGTNPSTGLTCAAGDESVGIAFNPPTAGVYEVCMASSFFADVNNGDTNIALQIIQTPNNAQTNLAQGGGRTSARVGAGATVRAAVPFESCGTFTLSDTSKATFRLMHERSNSGTVTAANLQMDREATVGQRDMKVRVRRKVEFQDAVKFTNLVTTGRQQGLRAEFVIFNLDGGGCTITSQSGAFSGAVRDSTGRCTMAVAGFSSTPACTCNSRGNSSTFCSPSTGSPTSQQFNFINIAGTNTDPSLAMATCVGF